MIFLKLNESVDKIANIRSIELIGKENINKINKLIFNFIKNKKLLIIKKTSIEIMTDEIISYPITVYSPSPSIDVKEIIDKLKKDIENVKIEYDGRKNHNIKLNQVCIFTFFYINEKIFVKLPFNVKNEVKILKPLYNLINVYDTLSSINNYKDWFRYIGNEKKIKKEIKSNKTNEFSIIDYFKIDSKLYDIVLNKIIKNNKTVILTGYQACQYLINKYKLKPNILIKKGKFEIITNTPELLIEKITEVLGSENIYIIVINKFWTEYRNLYYRIFYKGQENKNNIIDIYAIYDTPHSFNNVDNIQIANIYNIFSNILMQNILVSKKNISKLIENFFKERDRYLKINKLWGFEEKSGLSVMQNNYLKGTFKCN
jgi:hypothetical protein